MKTPRTRTIKYLLYANTTLYGLYLLSDPGSFKLIYDKCFVATPNSATHSLLFFHFSHTSLPYFLFNSAVMYTLGNYHVLRYGSHHFLRLFGMSALGGSIFTALQFYSNKEGYAAGGIAPSAGLIAYNVFRNPQWFRYLVGPSTLMSLVLLYGILYNDRAAIGGFSLGYLTFLIGL